MKRTRPEALDTPAPEPLSSLHHSNFAQDLEEDDHDTKPINHHAIYNLGTDVKRLKTAHLGITVYQQTCWESIRNFLCTLDCPISYFGSLLAPSTRTDLYHINLQLDKRYESTVVRDNTAQALDLALLWLLNALSDEPDNLYSKLYNFSFATILHLINPMYLNYWVQANGAKLFCGTRYMAMYRKYNQQSVKPYFTPLK